jgi:hypothetical protein
VLESDARLTSVRFWRVRPRLAVYHQHAYSTVLRFEIFSFFCPLNRRPYRFFAAIMQVAPMSLADSFKACPMHASPDGFTFLTMGTIHSPFPASRSSTFGSFARHSTAMRFDQAARSVCP